MNRMKDKIAIVTGSTSGIGRGIARLFAAEGATVIICGRREEKGRMMVEEIEKAGGKAAYHFMDVTIPESIEKLMADTAETYGRIDVPVNNAANVGLPDGRVDEVSLEMWDAIFSSDVRGTFYASEESAYFTGQVVTVDGGLDSHAPTVAQFVELGSRTW